MLNQAKNSTNLRSGLPAFQNTKFFFENGSVVFENEHFGDSILIKDLAFRMLVALIRMLVQTIATTPTVQFFLEFKKNVV